MNRKFSWIMALGCGSIAIAMWASLFSLRAHAQAPAKQGSGAPDAARKAELESQRDRLLEKTQRLRSEGKLSEAIEAAKQLLAVVRELFGEDNAAVVGAFEWMASIHDQADDWGAVDHWMSEAVAWRERVDGPDNWHTINARWSLKYAQTMKGLSEEQRKKVREANRARSDYLRYFNEAKYAEAAEAAQRALAIRKEVFGETHPHYGESLNDLARAENQLGAYKQAEQHYRDSANVRKESLGARHPDYADSLGNLALLYYHLGDYDRAEPLYLETIEVYRKSLGERSQDFAGSLNGLGGLYQSRGEYDRASPLLEQASDIWKTSLGVDHPLYALGLNNLAGLYQTTGDYEQAKNRYLEALLIRKITLGEEHRDYAKSLANLASNYRRTGDFSLAAPLYNEALEIQKKVLGETHRDYGESLSGMALVDAALGNWDLARDRMSESMAIDQRALEEVFSASTEEEMRIFFASRFAELDKMLSLPAADGYSRHANLRWVLRRKAIIFEMISRLTAVQQLASDDPSISEKRRQLLAARRDLENLLIRPPVGVRPSIVEKERDALISRIKVLDDALQTALAAYLGDDSPLEPTMDQIREALPQGSALVEIVLHHPYDFSALGRGRHWGEARYVAFILFADADREVELVDLGSAAPIDELVANISAQMKELSDSHATTNWKVSEANFLATAKPLSESVWAPIAAKLGEVRKIFLAADSQLHNLPFEALVDASGDYLAESNYSFAYMTSGRDLLRTKHTLGQGVFVFAGPDYREEHAARYAQVAALDAAPNAPPATAASVAAAPDDPSVISGVDQLAGPRGLRIADIRLGWKVLPNMAEEGREAGAAFDQAGFGDVAVYLAADALEDRVKRLKSPRVMVFVTHGEFLGDDALAARAGQSDSPEQFWAQNEFRAKQRMRESGNPLLRSFLVLAGANQLREPLPKDVPADRLDDGWLTAQEISQLDLRGTDLVVLSACNTSKGHGRAGDAVAGMRSAFMFAGARSIVGSLYSVPDQETRELMKGFYEGVARGGGKLESLDNAKRGYIKTLRQRDGAAHPFLWSSFVLIGEP